MGVSKAWRRRRTCGRKWQVGNAYRTLEHARELATKMSEKTGDTTIEAFHCDQCGRYHIGRSGSKHESTRENR